MSQPRFKTLDNFEVKDADRGIVTAHVTTLNVVDKDREVILPGAIREGATVLISAYGHSIPLNGEAPVGKGAITFTGDAGIFRGAYFMNVPRARDAFEVVKQMGSASHWSLGFYTEKDSPPSAEWRARGAVRMLEKLDVFECSPVARGASLPGTATLSAKTAPAVADPAVVQEGLAARRRTEALAAVLKEKNGPIAIDCAGTAVRWITGGIRQDTPVVHFFDASEFDYKRMGYYKPSEPDAIYVARGLSVEELCATICHECSHLVDGPSSSEFTARIDEKYHSARYLESLRSRNQ
jgi:hypothetical protein